jgi:RHS repeat-associated protein
MRYTKNDPQPPSSTYGTLINGTSGTITLSLGHVTLQAIAFKAGMTDSPVHSADFDYDNGQGPMTYPLDMAGIQFGQGPMAPDVSTVTYTLDKAGNRTSVNSTSYSPNSINQYTSVGGTAVTNGNEHEIKLYGGFTYYYMRDQELTRVTATGFTYDLAYDALGRCVRRTINNDPAYTTYYIYDGDKPILEYNANGGLLGFNLYGKGIDEILERGANGTDNQWHWSYFQQDHEGSVTHLTDWTGAIIERYRYDAFGAPTIYAPNWTVRTSTSYGNRFLFTGREYDGAWVYEYRARVYHSSLGRFMSEDPKLFDAGDYNLFRYCHNDPIDMTDPMGLGALPNMPYHLTPELLAYFQGQQLAHLQALQKALGWPGHGAIQMGQVNYALAQTGVQLRASYAAINQQKLSQLGSVFRPMASRFVGSANEMLNPEGYEVKIADQGGYRSFAEQAKLRAVSDAGGPHANKPGESAHNYGAAIDIDVIKGSRANEDVGRRAYNSVIGRLGALGESQGLIWGGHFSHPDPPHFQYSGIPVNGPDMLRLHLLRPTGAGLDTLMGIP